MENETSSAPQTNESTPAAAPQEHIRKFAFNPEKAEMNAKAEADNKAKAAKRDFKYTKGPAFESQADEEEGTSPVVWIVLSVVGFLMLIGSIIVVVYVQNYYRPQQQELLLQKHNADLAGKLAEFDEKVNIYESKRMEALKRRAERQKNIINLQLELQAKQRLQELNAKKEEELAQMKRQEMARLEKEAEMKALKAQSQAERARLRREMELSKAKHEEEMRKMAESKRKAEEEAKRTRDEMEALRKQAEENAKEMEAEQAKAAAAAAEKAATA